MTDFFLGQDRAVSTYMLPCFGHCYRSNLIHILLSIHWDVILLRFFLPIFTTISWGLLRLRLRKLAESMLRTQSFVLGSEE